MYKNGTQDVFSASDAFPFLFPAKGQARFPALFKNVDLRVEV